MKSKEIQASSFGKILLGLGWLRPSFERFGSDLEIMDREWNIT